MTADPLLAPLSEAVPRVHPPPSPCPPLSPSLLARARALNHPSPSIPYLQRALHLGCQAAVRVQQALRST